uniref:ShKT domain-containing protein n=1 Tax=Globodera pallida TaxID=36090 RepID=A0A183CAN0_GLOPA
MSPHSLLRLLLILFTVSTKVLAIRFLHSKTRIDLCESGSCGPSGKCVPFPHGARCQCAAGWMGAGCRRELSDSRTFTFWNPAGSCQDIYNSCDRWLQEGRCVWTRPFSSFFMDNCPLTCGVCRRAPGQKSLPIPLPPMLEALSWLVGRWKTQTVGRHSDRFPAPMSSGPYILDVQLSDVPAFDRPPLNISVRARTLDDTGFVEEEGRTPNGRDMVAMALVSNTGLMTIEEGELVGQGVLFLTTRWHRDFQQRTSDQMGDRIHLETVHRSFRALDKDTLEERLDYALRGQPGTQKRVSKRYRRTHDYLLL